MTTHTWLDAEIDLHNARISAMRLAGAALDEVEPWLSVIEALQLKPTRRMLEVRTAHEQTALDEREAELRRAEG